MGGSPTRSANLRANVARETPASPASSATVHGRAGSACSRRSARPTTGSPNARYQAGGSTSGPANHSRRVASSSRSSSRSRTAC